MPSDNSPAERVTIDPTFDRASAHRWAKEQHDKVCAAESVLRGYHDNVQETRARRKHASIWARLADLPVDVLAQRGRKIKRQPLIAHGVRTALDVIELGYARLVEIDQIGDRSASQLISLAQNAALPQLADLQPPKDTKKWTPADVDLARALQVFASAASLMGMPHLAALQQLVATLKLLEQATGWLRWLFSGRARRSATRARYANLRSTSDSTGRALGQVLDGLAQARQLGQKVTSPGEVIGNWNKAIADMHALLERFVAEGNEPDERAAAHGLTPPGLSSAIRERISVIRLDDGLVARNLRGYQVFGAKFALAVGRGLLGDDMGLGKTIQALAAIAHTISTEGENNHVVICPASLIDNWLREIKETIPQVLGSAFRGADRPAAIERWRASGGILLTSYEQAKHLLDETLPHLGFVVVDEAHQVKEPSAKRTEVTTKLVQKAHRALLMSGTSLENRAGELISLAALVDPSRGQRLRDRFGDGRDAHHEPDQFRRELGEFYLRRNQEEVLTELPDLIRTDVPTAVGEPEGVAYREAISQNNLARARMSLAAGAGINSQKMLVLREIISNCRSEDRRVLIFTEFRSVLGMVADVVGPDCILIHGDVTPAKRSALIEEFQNSSVFAALAIQIRAGGVGLNLQAASVVVLMEPQYKPSTEWQAVARAHRMGQSQSVMVYRLVAVNSIEERIVELTDFKAELFEKLAKHSELADSSVEARDRQIERRLLHEERRRLGLTEESDQNRDRRLSVGDDRVGEEGQSGET
jgi:superfamily II DNA or RNA helicase